MAKVEDASSRLQFLSPHFAPGNSYGLPIPATSTFSLTKVNESNLGINLFFTENGVEQKSPGLLSLTTVSVPYKRDIVTSIVYADIDYFTIWNITNDSNSTPWCVVPVGGDNSQDKILCVPSEDAAHQVVDALATLAVACGRNLGTSPGMELTLVSEKYLRKHPGQFGCIVGRVDVDGPAAQADIQEGDYMHTLNGIPCGPDPVISTVIAKATEKPQGGVVQAEILRKGGPMTIDLRFPHVEVPAAQLRQQIADLARHNSAPAAAAPSTGAAAAPPPADLHLGIYVRAVTDSNMTALGLSKPKGVVVTYVEKGGLAEEMQMQAGDVILAVNGSEIGDVDFFTQFVRSGAAKSFRLWRKGQMLEVAVPQSI